MNCIIHLHVCVSVTVCHPLKLCSASTTTIPLEYVADDINKATHNKLDCKMVEDWGDNEWSLSKLNAFHLLELTVSNSENKLNQNYTNIYHALALLKQHPELLVKLDKAWKAQTFQDIQRLSKCKLECRSTWSMWRSLTSMCNCYLLMHGLMCLAMISSIVGSLSIFLACIYILTLGLDNALNFSSGRSVPLEKPTTSVDLKSVR